MTPGSRNGPRSTGKMDFAGRIVFRHSAWPNAAIGCDRPGVLTAKIPALAPPQQEQLVIWCTAARNASHDTGAASLSAVASVSNC